MKFIFKAENLSNVSMLLLLIHDWSSIMHIKAVPILYQYDFLVILVLNKVTPRQFKRYMSKAPKSFHVLETLYVDHERERTFQALPKQFKENGKTFTLHTPGSNYESIEQEQQKVERHGYITMVVTVYAGTSSPTRKIYKAPLV
jgi:hypothetical protein